MRFPYVCLEHLTLAKRTLTSSQATTGLISVHKHLPQKKTKLFHNIQLRGTNTEMDFFQRHVRLEKSWF